MIQAEERNVGDELEKILLRSSEHDFDQKLQAFRRQMLSAARFAGDADAAVEAIVRDVARRADQALLEYTRNYDHVELTPGQLRISADKLARAHRRLQPELLQTIRLAIENVRKYQAEIFVYGRSDARAPAGIRYLPIKRLGVCVPGAAAPLPSTVIMTVVPAQVAGVRQIAVVSPPRYNNSIHPVILAVCHELGLDEVYRVGGAQAVAALAYGTETIPMVDMIVGPGNRWVQAAKKIVAGDSVHIDSLAGPSEVLIIASDAAEPAWVAADMLSQAEHGTDSTAVLITDSEPLGRAVLRELARQLKDLSRADEARQSLAKFGRIFVVDSLDRAVQIADQFAAEHLQLQCGDLSRPLAQRITNAGAIFIGPHTPVAVGDYWAGPSHTLPTGSRARFASALTSNDFVKSISIVEYNFVKSISIVEYSPEQLAADAEHIVRLAEVEGLDAHANSVRIRLPR